MRLSVKEAQEAPSRAGGGVQDAEQLLGSQGSSEGFVPEVRRHGLAAHPPATC